MKNEIRKWDNGNLIIYILISLVFLNVITETVKALVLGN